MILLKDNTYEDLDKVLKEYERRRSKKLKKEKNNGRYESTNLD